MIRKYVSIIFSETSALLRQPIPLLAAIVLPLAGAFIISLAFVNGLVRDIPIEVIDADNSSLSRTITRYLDAAEVLKVDNASANLEEARNRLLNQKTYAIIYIPRGSEQRVKSGKSAEVSIVGNGASLVYSKIIFKSAATTLNTVSSGVAIKKFMSKGISPAEAKVRSMPLRTELYAPGNPTLDYKIYLLPGMVFALLQMSAGFSFIFFFRNKNSINAARYIPRGWDGFQIQIARAIPLIIANAITAGATLAVMFPVMGLPIGGSFAGLYLLTLAFMCASAAFGALASALFENLVVSAQILLVINAPAFVFSGYSFPRFAMPKAIQDVASGLPLTHFLDGFVSYYIFDEPNMGAFAALGFITLALLIIISAMLTKPGELWRRYVKL